MSLEGMPSTGAVHLDLSDAGMPPWVAELFRVEAGGLEALFGLALVVGPPEPGEPVWRVVPHPEGTPVAVEWDAERLQLTSEANTARELLDSTILLARLVRSDGNRVAWSVPSTVDEAIDILVDALGHDASYWGLADEDWPTVRDRALLARPTDWDTFRAWAEELLAHLPDGHARVADMSRPGFHPPYRARLDGGVTILDRVPEHSAAYRAGVRPGWTIAVDDPERWWRTTPASPQDRPWRAARRYLRVVGDARRFTATGPGGHTASWTEVRDDDSPGDLITVSHNPSGAVLVRLDWFSDDPRVTEVMDDLCRQAGPDDHLVLDLRSNPGGKVVVSNRLLRRFLRGRTLLGTTRYSDGRGGLGPARERWAEPGTEPRWPGHLTILVDRHTFSAAEAFTSSLQGLPHVTVLGDVTGGGIGMPGHIPLGHDLEAWFASAIYSDRAGNPVDVRGVHPDGLLTTDPREL